MSRKPVAVVGQGAWGTAMACVLADAGNEVLLWCHDQTDADCIARERINQRYMPSVRLSDSIVPSVSLAEVLRDSEYVFEAIPVQFLRSVLRQAAPFARLEQTWVVLSKGIEQETLALPSQIIAQELGTIVTTVLSGPSYADEVIAQQPTGVLVAGTDGVAVAQVCRLVSTPSFVAHPHNDPIGVQLCGAIKNLVALAVGIVQGAGYGENTQALALTAGWHDTMQLLQHCDSQTSTINSLAGIGDLVLTATGSKSRNRQVGIALGAGESLESILERTGYIPEGINTVQSIYTMVKTRELSTKLIEPLYRCIFDSNSSAESLVQHIIGS